MKCYVCGENKLSKEFPQDNISPECCHPPLHCLRCVVSCVKSTGECPFEGCKQKLSADSERVQDCEDQLEFLFPSVVSVPPTDEVTDSGAATLPVVHVTTLTGDFKSFRFSPSMTVRQLKNKIAEQMNVEPWKQHLVYSDKEIKTTNPDGRDCRLSQYDVKPFSTIHLMVLLYSIPENFNHVIFDLSWQYPASGRDFLDASCMLFMGSVWYSFIDWMFPGVYGHQVWHSGDSMDDKKKVGRHRIEAKLKDIPKCVSHIVFVLSSFRSSCLSGFPSATLNFYDASDPSKVLPHQKFDRTSKSQALIVACVSRTEDNRWNIYVGGQESPGNTKHCTTIANTISALIKSNMFPGTSLAKGTPLVRDMTYEESLHFKRQCEKR